ncbi:hypothetical protein [Leeia oryzae]|uniref:hypothetical protein n=1 Tax=Leeia oryzae TaxID=356662 RepID=UPI000361766F|nr:hypothetical protein [Leeia oryzae]
MVTVTGLGLTRFGLLAGAGFRHALLAIQFEEQLHFAVFRQVRLTVDLITDVESLEKRLAAMSLKQA